MSVDLSKLKNGDYLLFTGDGLDLDLVFLKKGDIVRYNLRESNYTDGFTISLNGNNFYVHTKDIISSFEKLNIIEQMSKEEIENYLTQLKNKEDEEIAELLSFKGTFIDNNSAIYRKILSIKKSSENNSYIIDYLQFDLRYIDAGLRYFNTQNIDIFKKSTPVDDTILDIYLYFYNERPQVIK